MKLQEYLDSTRLETLLIERYVVARKHPRLPLYILNYSPKAMFDGNWCDEVRKCRGLIVHREIDVPWSDSEIVARPMPKFFNLGETPETKECNLPSTVPEVSEKMDGQLGILWRWVDSAGQKHSGIATRGSFESEGAIYASERLEKLVKYGAIEEFPEDWTPHFEIIAGHLRIVVDYPFEGLVLLSMVHNETGSEASRYVLEGVYRAIATYSSDGRPWIRLVERHELNLRNCLSVDGEQKNREGFVLTYHQSGNPPLKVKVKFEEYRRLHKLITGITPQQLWFALSQPLFQWTEGELPAKFREWTQEWRDRLYKAFQSKLEAVSACMVSEMFKNAETIDRKTLVEAVNHLAEGDTVTRNAVLALSDGKVFQAYQVIWNSVRPTGRTTEIFYFEGKGE